MRASEIPARVGRGGDVAERIRDSAASFDPEIGIKEPHTPLPAVSTAVEAEATAWTLWGRGTANGFDGKLRDDFLMDGGVRRLSGLGLPLYAHWSPRPGLGVWGLSGAGWGNLALRDEAGKVKTDLEMLMVAVGARQELLTWR